MSITTSIPNTLTASHSHHKSKHSKGFIYPPNEAHRVIEKTQDIFLRICLMGFRLIFKSVFICFVGWLERDFKIEPEKERQTRAHLRQFQEDTSTERYRTSISERGDGQVRLDEIWSN